MPLIGRARVADELWAPRLERGTQGARMNFGRRSRVVSLRPPARLWCLARRRQVREWLVVARRGCGIGRAIRINDQRLARQHSRELRARRARVAHTNAIVKVPNRAAEGRGIMGCRASRKVQIALRTLFALR